MTRRFNSDEGRRRLERRAREVGGLSDRIRAAIAAERLDGAVAASRIDEVVWDLLWRSDEVMNKHPGSWIREDKIGKSKVAELVLEASGRPGVFASAHELRSLDHIRLCEDTRHATPCPYDGCEACNECEAPTIARHDRRLAMAFVVTYENPESGEPTTFVGIKAAPGGSSLTRIDGPAILARRLFGIEFSGLGYGLSRIPAFAWRFAWPLERFFSNENAFGAEVRVFDNQYLGAAVADRFSILMEGEVDGEPYYVLFRSSAQLGPQGVWYVDAEGWIDFDNLPGAELSPWATSVPIDVFNAIWNERGSAIFQAPQELVERWALLVLGGQLSKDWPNSD